MRRNQSINEGGKNLMRKKVFPSNRAQLFSLRDKSFLRSLTYLIVMIVATITWTEALDQMQQMDLRGAWDANEYVMKDGTKHATKGHIFFSGTDWTVLFFIINVNGEVKSRIS